MRARQEHLLRHRHRQRAGGRGPRGRTVDRDGHQAGQPALPDGGDEGRRRLRRRPGRGGAGRERAAAPTVDRLRRRAGPGAPRAGACRRRSRLRLASEWPVGDPAVRQGRGGRGRDQLGHVGPAVPRRRAAGADRGLSPGRGGGVPHAARELREDHAQGGSERELVRGAAAGRRQARVRAHGGQPAENAGVAARAVRVVGEQGDGRLRQRDVLRVPRGRGDARPASEDDRLRPSGRVGQRGRGDPLRLPGPARHRDGGGGGHRSTPVAAPAPDRGVAGRFEGARVPAGERPVAGGMAAPEPAAALRLRDGRRGAVPGAAGGGVDDARPRHGGVQDLRRRPDGRIGRPHAVRLRDAHEGEPAPVRARPGRHAVPPGEPRALHALRLPHLHPGRRGGGAEPRVRRDRRHARGVPRTPRPGRRPG